MSLNPFSRDSEHLLQIYLNDHRAGAVVGLAVAKRLADSNDGTELGATVSEIAAEIEDEQRSLDLLFEHFGLHQNPLKQTAALVGERLGRFKMNGRLASYSPLSRLWEVEALMAGIDAKRSMWLSLRTAAGEDRIADVDLVELTERADSQRARLFGHHQDAARDALTPEPDS